MSAIKPILSAMLRSRSAPVLLLLQIILSVAIVANAAFIIHQRLGLMERDSGVAEAEVLSFKLYNFGDGVDLKERSRRDLDLLRTLPGVKTVAPVNMLPLGSSGWRSGFVDGPDPDTAKSLPGMAVYMGDENLLETFGLKLIEGRNFIPGRIAEGLNDTEVPREVIVTKAYAKAAFGDESPIGKRVYEGGITAFTIVGVVDKLQSAWVNDDEVENSVLVNVNMNGTGQFNTMVVRAEAVDHARLTDAIKEVLHRDDPRRVLFSFKSIAQYRESAYAQHAMMAFVLGAMIVLLLAITALGLSGMVMFNIERRTKQIGTRRALGATRGNILGWFLTENYLLLGTGALVGSLLAFELSRQLMDFFSLDALAWQYPAVTVVLLFVVTTIAVIIPARRAAAISPSIATRSV
ncbi:FtsX-like permease family protein [Shewanella sp. FJAT-52076]|uniref:FtsX-like permease family protein n=1 Tax=Shewanella sp. FJAT-52076 TaxID=2864202 RepID=UPI001C65F3AE|nr:FtsX-like permease family protein [Shewanella sp. FJAT-52076]QYJ74624.1 ABC transporter permease [Shewanella sp. FJAT-52076]